MLKLQTFGSYNREKIEVCPHCSKDPGRCRDCGDNWDDCGECGESIRWPDTYLIFTNDHYNGKDSCWQDTVNLMIDGECYATAHINKLEEDKSADVAHMHIYVPLNKQDDEQVAIILADFAKWVRFNWDTFDKKVNELPTLVRLMGCITHEYLPSPYQHEWFVALRNACDIKVEHIAYEFTHISKTTPM